MRVDLNIDKNICRVTSEPGDQMLGAFGSRWLLHQVKGVLNDQGGNWVMKRKGTLHYLRESEKKKERCLLIYNPYEKIQHHKSGEVYRRLGHVVLTLIDIQNDIDAQWN